MFRHAAFSLLLFVLPLSASALAQEDPPEETPEEAPEDDGPGDVSTEEGRQAWTDSYRQWLQRVGDDPEEAFSYALFFSKLPEWGRFYPTVPNFDGPDAEKAQPELTKKGKYNVVKEHRSLTKTPHHIIVFEPVDAFWLGAIVQGRTVKDGLGSLAEVHVPAASRRGFLIGTTLTTTTELPEVLDGKVSAARVQRAIAGLIQDGSRQFDPGTAFVYEHTENESREQAAYSLGLDAHFMSAEASATLDTSKDVGMHSVSALFMEKAFTVSVDFEGMTGADAIFSKEASEDAQQVYDTCVGLFDRGEVTPENLPCYVKSITYGRLLLVSITSTHKSSEIEAALHAKYEALKSGAALDAKHSKVLSSSETKIKITSYGGPMAAISDQLIREGRMSEFFSTDAPLTTMRPISYTINSVREDRLASMARTTEYTATHFEDANATAADYSLDIRFEIMTADGGKYPEQECYGWVKLDGQTIWSVSQKEGHDNSRDTTRGPGGSLVITTGHSLGRINLTQPPRSTLEWSLWDEDDPGADDLLSAGFKVIDYRKDEAQNWVTKEVPSTDAVLKYHLTRGREYFD